MTTKWSYFRERHCFYLNAGTAHSETVKWLGSRVLKVLCLHLYFRNYVRSDVPSLGNIPAFRRQLSLDSRMRLYYFVFFPPIISDSVEVLNVNVLNFFMGWKPVVRQGLLFIEFSRLHSDTPHSHGRNRLDDWSARRRDLHLTTHNYHRIQISMPPARFEPVISAIEQRQSHVLDRVATWSGEYFWKIKQTTGLHGCDIGKELWEELSHALAFTHYNL